MEELLQALCSRSPTMAIAESRCPLTRFLRSTLTVR